MLIALASETAFAAEPSEWDGIAAYNAKRAVEARLRDPKSAEFRNIAVYRPVSQVHAPQAVCGQVNARNGFGGFTGFIDFVWVPLGPDMKPDIKRGTAFIGHEAEGFLSLCRNAKR